MKLFEVINGGFMLWCPGCKHGHHFDKRWKLEGSLDVPTFKSADPLDPRHSYWLKYADVNCHFTVLDGKMLFAPDCTHELRGQTIDVPEWPS